MRAILRNILFRLVRRLLLADDGRDILTHALNGQLATAHSLPDAQLLSLRPYADLCSPTVPSSLTRGPIFITGRFRSGSTLLWNVFRHVPECRSYYEPLNERRWFDPNSRGAHTDNTHKHVDDYWSEYDGLFELAEHYREDWIRTRLYMDEGDWDPGLKQYINILIAQSSGRAVLQFNRVDFRLPWLRAQFPSAKIVHLYRHPRDQWVSTLLGDKFPVTGRIADFESRDKFYLLMWTRDLRRRLPVLNVDDAEHPYVLFYLIWRLSYLFGRQFADWSLSFESLVQNPEHELNDLFQYLGIETSAMDSILRVVERPALGKWNRYADNSWFCAHEQKCEALLAEFFAATRHLPAVVDRSQVTLMA
jgi:hypothetical protein